MTAMNKKELEFMRLGYLTLYLLKRIEDLPQVEMEPYLGLLTQEVEKKSGLGAGKSLVYKRLQGLLENGHIKAALGASSNPKAKKPVQFFRITKDGKKLLENLKTEQQRLSSLCE